MNARSQTFRYGESIVGDYSLTESLSDLSEFVLARIGDPEPTPLGAYIPVSKRVAGLVAGLDRA